MAFAPTHSLLGPISRPFFFPSKSFEVSFSKLPLGHPSHSRSVLSAASSSYNHPSSPLTSEKAVLEAVAELGDSETYLPAVRTYENDLARLTLVGAVDFQQALSAGAADGGEAADEHLSSGMSTMVIETIFPGHPDDHSTVSTRLFLPAIKVKEKAVRLKRFLTKDVLQGTSSKNILAMTFRQVVLERLWSFELALFSPGTKRNMENLEDPREVPILLTLSSSDEYTISDIGEVICTAALENMERHFLHDSSNRASSRFLSLFQKRKHISSKNSSVVLYNFVEHEILANAKVLLEKFNMERGKHELVGTQLKKSWLISPAFSKLEKIGGSEFCAWISECVPSYKLEIDANKHRDVKFEGWKKSEGDKWEVVLTHSQMISLVDNLDIYYEDTFTLPNKRLLSNAAVKSSNLDLKKGQSLLKMLSVVIASGILLVAISVLGKLYMPHLPIRKKFVQENPQAPTSDIYCVPLHSVELSELEKCCVSIIRRMKDSFGWPGEISKKSGLCAWIGEPPNFLSRVYDTDLDMLEISSTSMPVEASEEEMKALDDIASYQVTVSTDWHIVGFQPTNRVAVNNWAANPLAKELYGGKKPSPGLLEPGVKISKPSGVVVLELLTSLNPSCYFALVRAIDSSKRLSSGFGICKK